MFLQFYIFCQFEMLEGFTILPDRVLSGLVRNGSKWQRQISPLALPFPIHAVPGALISSAELTSSQQINTKNALPFFRTKLNV